MESMKINGVSYFIPESMYTHGFFYDAAMFRELGLEVPNTWDDLMDVCETLKENGIAPVTLDGTTDLYNEWWFIRFAERLTTMEKIHAAAKGDAAFADEPAFLKAAQYVATFSENGYFQDGAAGSVFPAAQALFTQGKAGLLFCGAWIPTEMASQTPPEMEMKMFALPELPDSVSPWHEEIWSNAAGITVDHKGAVETIDLTEDDLLFITNGGCVESCTVGAQNKATGFDPAIKPGNGWDLWKRIAALDDSFGHPEKFCSQPELSNWESATITTLDEKIPRYIQKICKRDPFSGRTVTGGIVTVKDSAWLLSWTLNRQQQFRAQPKDQLCVWVYGLFSDKPGDYVKKPMRDCTGREICMEWLYHLGVPVEDIAELAEHSANTVPVMMPYIDAFFMPRAKGDRPDIVPKDAVNFAFLGQFAETGRDTIFTTEYSMRTGMEAVYRLLNIDRGVPEVWGSTYDVRALVDASVKLRDGRKLTDMELPLMGRIALKEALKKIEGTDLEKFLRQYHAI